MSTKKMGLRRVGIVGLSTLVVTSMMTLSAATSFAAAGAYTAGKQLNVTRGATGQAAGDLTLQFANTWGATATQSFQIMPSNAANVCTPATKPVDFAAVPTVTVTGPAPDDAAATTPTFVAALASSGVGCGNDIVTITQAAAATGNAGDLFAVKLSNITYNVGSTAPLGPVHVATTPALSGGLTGNNDVVNALAVSGNFTNTPVIAAVTGAPDVSLGTQTFKEFSAGALFPSGTHTYTLTLSGGAVFDNTITPTFSGVPSTYAVAGAGYAGSVYSFTVTGPSPSGLVPATVTINGLKANVGGTVETVSLTAAGSNFGPSQTVAAINVLNPYSRTGGATRYETAAALFNSQLGMGNPFWGATSVVLSGGELYPDALSANYLTARLANNNQNRTGTLLTTPDGLSTAASMALITPTAPGDNDNGPTCIDTVYITGGTTAISQAVQDQVKAMHQCADQYRPHIITVRLGGPTRFETNQLVNEHNFAGRGTVNTVLLASGAGYADALSLGPVAAGLNNGHTGIPLILTQGGANLGLTATTQLSDFLPNGVGNIVIAGGTTVISQSIQDSLTEQGYTVLRLGGADRTLTAAAIAGWATAGVFPFSEIGDPFKGSQHYNTQRAYITTGSNFADAVAAGPVAAARNHVILLSNSPTDLGLGIPSYLGRLVVGDDVSNLHALGLTAATSNSLMNSVGATIGNALTPVP